VEYYGLAGINDVRPGDTVSPSELLLLIRIAPKYSCDIEGLPHNIFTLDWERFTYYGGKDNSVALGQFPVVLSYAITHYKCQGQTYDAIVADLRKPQGFASTASFYVQLSRCRTLAAVSIISSFDESELRKPHADALGEAAPIDASTASESPPAAAVESDPAETDAPAIMWSHMPSSDPACLGAGFFPFDRSNCTPPSFNVHDIELRGKVTSSNILKNPRSRIRLTSK
jgi:hypothetical protein